MVRDVKSIYKTVKNVIFVALGTFLIAFGASVFQLPFDLVAGGMSGIAIVLTKIFDSAILTVDFYVAVMTWATFILGLVVLGKSFAMKTLVSALVYPVAFSLSSRLVDPEVLGGIFDIGSATYTDAALVVASVFGGIIIGVGIALAFLGGGSTGGVDIVALCISRKVKRLTSAQIILIIDTLVILLGVFAIGDLVISLLGIVSAFSSSVVTDRIFGGGTRAFVADIVSDEYEAISRVIIEKINRTTTVVECRGAYSGKKKHLVKVSFNMSEYSALLAAVLEVDKNAFISVCRAHEINGEGWTRDFEAKSSESDRTA